MRESEGMRDVDGLGLECADGGTSENALSRSSNGILPTFGQPASNTEPDLANTQSPANGFASS